MRKVMVKAYINGKLLEKGEAIFHQFGCNYAEFENGPGNFTTAVVEWPDGSVENVYAEHVRFLDSTI